MDQEIDKLVNAKLVKDREHLLVKRGCAIKESIILNIANMPNPYEYEDNNEIQSTKIQNIDLKIRDVDDALNELYYGNGNRSNWENILYGAS